MKGRFFWIAIAVSSVAASYLGYQRFKKIRPDLFEPPASSAPDESERAARIAEYQQKGDALTRAALPPVRKLKPGEACVDGVVVMIAREGDGAAATAVVENGAPVRCDADAAAPAP
ncbi:MAG: hypothetical protein ACREPX_04435 [Rhodanobacteraceae bacterium]